MKRTPLRRSVPLRTQAGSRFPKRRTPEFLAWLRGQRCAVRTCRERGEVAHIRSRGAGGRDLGNTVPLCRWHHRYQHRVGIQSFVQEYFGSLDALRDAARGYAERYAREAS